MGEILSLETGSFPGFFNFFREDVDMDKMTEREYFLVDLINNYYPFLPEGMIEELENYYKDKEKKKEEE